MKNYNAEIGRWLAHKRDQRGLTQSDIGYALGVTKTAVHYWETGRRTIDANTMFAYCEILGVDPQQLVNDVTKRKDHPAQVVSSPTNRKEIMPSAVLMRGDNEH